MLMSPTIRKLSLTAHVTVAVGWLGALIVFFAHAVPAVMSNDAQIVRVASLAMGLTAWFVIAPLALFTLITGLLQALGTAWGLFRHYWMIFKLVLTAIATAVLLLKLGPIAHLAGIAARPAFAPGDLVNLRTSLLVHALGGLAILLIAVALALLMLLVGAMLLAGGHGPAAHLPTR